MIHPRLARETTQTTQREMCATCDHTWHGAPCHGCACMGPFVGVTDAWLPVKTAIGEESA